MFFTRQAPIIVRRYLDRVAQGQGQGDSGKGGVPAQWVEWLKAEHQGGKEKVGNPNADTKSRFPQVSYSTALKYKPFYQKALEEYKEWVKDQAGKGKKETKPKEEEPKPAKKAGTSILKTGKRTVGKVTYESKLDERTKKTVESLWGKEPPSMEDFHAMFDIGGDRKTSVLLKNGYKPGSIAVELTFEDNSGKTVGAVTRLFHKSGDKLQVTHDLFKLDESLQGKGVGRKVIEKSLDDYKKMGVSQVKQESAWVGRYTWAKMGYQADNMDEVKEGARTPLLSLGYSEKQVDDILRDEVPNLSALADLTTPSGRKIGKEVLLHDDMPNVMVHLNLDESDPGYKRMKAYLAKDKS